MRTVRLSHEYTANPHELWAICIDLDALADMMDGLVSFEGLPSGQIYEGQEIDVQVSLFGRLPSQPYHMRVDECDANAMRVRSTEFGAGVQSWRHTMIVEPTSGGSKLIDVIEIEAGWLTWAFALWARYVYQSRHAARQKMLERRRIEAL